MNIKNIQQYRSFYKNEIRDLPTRDENFIGNFLIDQVSGKKKFGWFEIYHGDKEGYGKAEAGIENFLQSFLDMAKDGQAVYEFLQNAVDAGSTHYTMVWGQDKEDGNYYLLVANNGEMFNLNSIRSILNVGSSTKTADSQTIGKFGIGFKLAHRLVGKDNGLQELINENSGPLLFSWKNYEIAHLADGSSPVPVDVAISTNTKGSIIIEDDNPWLFKILITCFPCLPENDKVEELPKMANGIQAGSTPFSKSEYDVLSRWVKNNLGILNPDTYKKGALFFIKLGSGKETELAENNLKEGVKFALAILKETADTEIKKEKVLRTVQLNNEEPITYPDLEYIKLTVNKKTEQDTYAYIRFGVNTYLELTPEQKNKIADEADIEALFGFRKHNEIGDYFRGAPNLYLYFPLSEEVHNFNYILHSNAFYKGASRTFLHKGTQKEDGINERLLRTIVVKIDTELEKLSSSSDKKERQQFLHFYAALLTSDKSLNQDRLWIETPYINPINELLKKYIPVRKSLISDEFEISRNPQAVFIKQTNIEVDAEAWDLENVRWFYWGDDAETNILLNAENKLGIARYTIFDLLQSEGVDVSINKWMRNDPNKVIAVLTELQYFNREVTAIETIKPQLLNLKLFEFSSGETLSLAEFLVKEKDGYFLIHNTLGEIKDLLLKAGLIITTLDLNELKFIDTYRTYLLQGSKHRGYTELTQLFSASIKNENLTKLSKAEKLKVFNAFRTFNSEAVTERIKELKLFSNNLGKPLYFKNLFFQSDLPWLNKFCINVNEYDVQLKQFLLEDSKEIYQYIIFPFWAQVANYIADAPQKTKDVLDSIVNAYTNSTWQEKQKNLLSNQNLIVFQSEVIEPDGIFYHKALLLLSDEVYKSIQSTGFEYFGVHIPDKCMVPYLDVVPFSFSLSAINPTIADRTTSLDELNDLLLLSKTCNIDFFGSNCIILTDGVYCIDSTSGKRQIATSKTSIVNYINAYYPDEYILIPDALNVDKSKIELSDNALVVHLIERFAEDNDAQELDLIEIVLAERYEDKKALLNRLTFTKLDASWAEERQNELYLKLLREVVDGPITPEELTIIHKKISIINNEDEIVISDIESAHDSIEVFRGERKIILSQAQILNLENAETIKLIQAFHDETKKRDLVNTPTADKLFKISYAGITDEFVTRFKENLKLQDPLKNALAISNTDQLLFVLLSGKFEKEKNSKFAVKCHNNKWYFLKSLKVVYTEENTKYIKSESLLNECYNNLQSLLQISDLEVFNYGENEDDVIAPHFLFVKGINPGILESTEVIYDKLNYLQKGWANLAPTIREYKRDAVWASFLNISPNEFVLNGFQTEVEVLPEEFIAWYQNDKAKEELLKAIGINVNDSFIEKIRKYLLGVIKEYPPEIEIEKFNQSLLFNTMNGLAGDFKNLKGQPVIFNDPQHNAQLALLEKITNQIKNNKAEQYPVLIYHTNDSFKVLGSGDASIYQIEEILHGKLKAASSNNLNLVYKEYNILKQIVLLNTNITGSIEELEFQKTFVPSGNQIEHDEPFYHNWKKQNNIRLFKEKDLRFDVAIEIEEEITNIGRVVEGDYIVLYDDDGFQAIYYRKDIYLEELSALISIENNRLSASIDALISRKDSMLSSIYNAYNSADKDDISNEHLQALQAAFKEEDLKQERKMLIDGIKTSNKYSHSWFDSYLSYLLTFSSNQDNTKLKTIRFQSVKRQVVENLLSSKYYLLCGSSSYVSDSIEDISDFSLSITLRNNKKHEVKIEGAQKRGQDLLIYCPAGFHKEVLENLNTIIHLEIAFIPKMNLLKELKNAFVNKNFIDDWEDIKATIPNLHFIYGPPGTGKTTTLCSMIIDGIKEKYNAKYLLLTPTNKAADVLCKKLLKPSKSPEDKIRLKLEELSNQGKSISITRLGKATDPEIEVLDEDIYQDSVNTRQLNYTHLIASTVHRLPYTNVKDDNNDPDIKLFKLKDHWDYVIFDEASMTNLPYLVFAILSIYKFSPNAKFIIAGDPKQIPPVVDVNDKELEELDIQDENVYSMMGIRSFKKDEQIIRLGDKIENLNIQYRSVRKIGQLFSDLSYSKLLQHDREVKKVLAKPLPEVFRKLINNSVTFIDIPLNSEDSIFKIKQLFYSSYHIYSAILVAEIVKYFDSVLGENESWTIGLIAPYKAQAVLLNKLITSFGISDKLKIYSDTVHGFQGDECDIVFFISNPNKYYYTGYPKCLLSKEYIYNVAISRAKDYLIILHPFKMIRDNKYINTITDSYSEHFEKPVVRQSSEFENELFSQKDYIGENSYITGHDSVNVFGQIEKKYFIKANETAIDIQLRKFNS